MSFEMEMCLKLSFLQLPEKKSCLDYVLCPWDRKEAFWKFDDWLTFFEDFKEAQKS